LLQALTAAENAAVPLIAAGMKRSEAFERAKALLDQLGSMGGATHCPPRCLKASSNACDRAGSDSRAALVVCDEPTAALDHATGEAVMKLVAANAVQSGSCCGRRRTTRAFFTLQTLSPTWTTGGS